MEEKKRAYRRRLVIDVSEQDHMNIKIRSTQRGQSMREYVIKAIAAQIKRDEQYD